MMFFFLTLKAVLTFNLENSADADEMPQFAAFYLRLHCLPKYPFRSFQNTKGEVSQIVVK